MLPRVARVARGQPPLFRSAAAAAVVAAAWATARWYLLPQQPETQVAPLVQAVVAAVVARGGRRLWLAAQAETAVRPTATAAAAAAVVAAAPGKGKGRMAPEVRASPALFELNGRYKMWIVSKNDEIEILANNPDQNIFDVLREKNPGAEIYRSKKPCINEVNALIFAATMQEGDLIEVEEPAADENGEPIMGEDGSPIINRYETRGPGKAVSSQNKARMGDDALIVETKEGAEIARFELEQIQ